ncbi:hypothetical protein LCGC14_0687470 [marine sediment metagenome]|uniref:Uncharacterized protein n=1 Tax=marine sediment metagenome TaxID=412755 RepID=A0A0F9T7N9_9ZZZZ
MQKDEIKEKKSKEIFDGLFEKYDLDEVAYFCNRASDLMWKKRQELHVEKIKSQRKGAILQVGSGSHTISGERVKLLRKNLKYARVKVITGRRYKGMVSDIAYHWLKTELTDLKEARSRSESARSVKKAMSGFF